MANYFATMKYIETRCNKSNYGMTVHHGNRGHRVMDHM